MDFNWMKNKVDNSYSNALKVFGWIYIVFGVIGAFVIGYTSPTYYGGFNYAMFFATLFSVGIFGIILLGLAEIIKILNDNRLILASIAQGNNLDSENNNVKPIEEELPEI